MDHRNLHYARCGHQTPSPFGGPIRDTCEECRPPSPAAPPPPPRLGYAIAHDRVRQARGRATQHPCVSCGKRAAHWAYDHTDPDELTEVSRGCELTYSLDPARYQPMCALCHKWFDLGAPGRITQRESRLFGLPGPLSR